MLNSGNGNAAPRRWSPAPYSPPALQYQAVRPNLGQGETQVSALELFFRNPTLALITDVVAASASAYLAWGLSVRRNTCLVGAGKHNYPIEKCPSAGWVSFWWIIATAMGVKALHDLSEMKS